LARSLAARGMDVTILTIGERYSKEREDGITLYRLSPRNVYWSVNSQGKSDIKKLLFHAIDSWNPAIGGDLRRILERVRPAIFHSSTTEDLSPYAWRVAARLGIPVVNTLRSYPMLCPKATMFRKGKNCGRQCASCRLFTLPRRYLSRYVDRVVGISSAVLQTHLDAGYFPRARGTVIRNIYEKPEYAPVAASIPGRLRVGFIGRIERIKGAHILLKALAEGGFAARVELRVAGAGTEVLVEVAQAQSRGVSVELMGWVKPEEFYPTIDVLVVPSLWHEPLGRVVFEAYSYGVPVLGARRGGIPEIIEEGATGFVFNPEQPQDLIALLRRIVDEPRIVAEMRLNCIRKSREFSAERIGEQHQRLYLELLDSRGRVASTGSPESGAGD
jgi:glycosyltransferase involved in cell wall biosynthesis